MQRISSIEEFISFRNSILNEPEDNIPTLVISAGTCGQASGANEVMRMAKRYILENNLHQKVSIRVTGCLGFCEIEPFILVEPENYIYPNLKTEDVPGVIEATVKKEIAKELMYRENNDDKVYCTLEDIPFYKYQTRTILKRNQKIDPIRIFNYFKAGGYSAFEKAISNPDQEWIINEIKKAELRGRGGAGFPTGLKWENARNSGKGVVKKFVVCNADEGDPGAYMDRNVLEGNPQLIIEGMIIAFIHYLMYCCS